MRGRQRQRKRRLKTEVAFFQSSSRLFFFTSFVKCRRTLQKLSSWEPYPSPERERKFHRGWFTASIKRELRHYLRRSTFWTRPSWDFKGLYVTCLQQTARKVELVEKYFLTALFPISVGELGCNVTHHRMHGSTAPPRIARICLGKCLTLFRNVTWTEPRKTISLLTIERPGTEHCSGALSTELKRDCTINVLPSVTLDPKVLTQLIFFSGFGYWLLSLLLLYFRVWWFVWC